VIRWYARPPPGWIVSAPTIGGLAARINLPPDNLLETVSRFNVFCAVGRDDDFHRTTLDPHSHHWNHKRAGLEAISHPPFIGISFNRSFLATKGGPRTNECGQVLRPDGTVIPGLYCAGVAMANPIGTRAIGAGTTLGPNMTWGYICGLAISGLWQTANSESAKSGRPPD
jgi:3-oxosteroid 1-dehydrogenase